MIDYKIPHFVVKKNLQKSEQTGIRFSDIVTVDILRDVCKKITGHINFTYDYVDNDYKDNFIDTGYNKGRMVIMYYKDEVSFISFSEQEIRGRNSSIQSVPTAYNIFYMNPYAKKKLYYYFLNVAGNANTDYQMLIYRLMKTVGFIFLNSDEALGQKVMPFASIDDVMYLRKENSNRNQSNNSTYITKSESDQYDIYGKTYGANKYETSLMCYALSSLAQPHQKITLYEVSEGDLVELPKLSRDVLAKMGNISVVSTDIQLEKQEFIGNNSLRSPRYIYNLLSRLGPKRCACCNCEIPELIQGAHIWPVAKIKKAAGLNIDQKLNHAIDGNNGIWLCENHHKLFDEGLLFIDHNGNISYRDAIEDRHIAFMDEITTNKKLADEYLTDAFKYYIDKRNNL